MRISDWSSDVCSSDLAGILLFGHCQRGGNHGTTRVVHRIAEDIVELDGVRDTAVEPGRGGAEGRGAAAGQAGSARSQLEPVRRQQLRSEEHTSELQSLMRISYAVFCLNKKKQTMRT